MRKLDQTFLKFTSPTGETYYVSLFLYMNDPSIYDDEVDEDNLYEWADSPRGWMYAPID